MTERSEEALWLEGLDQEAEYRRELELWDQAHPEDAPKPAAPEGEQNPPF